MRRNILSKTDSYKISHWKQYPPGTEYVYSYLESRGGEFGETVFFGLRPILEHVWDLIPDSREIRYAQEELRQHFGSDIFNFDGWDYLRDNYLSLPIRIKAVPEGTVVPTGNVLMTIENTDPKVPWLTNFLETVLMQVWYPCTVATQSREMKKTILRFLEATGDPAGIDFKLHDFGFRGSTSVESAMLGGMAHLVNFKGTDTLIALDGVDMYYEADGPVGFSIPAAEHSTITSWGREHETEAYANMLDQYPTGLVAVVSDSYDIHNAVANIWGGTLKERVLARDGVLVIRPDSGDPHIILPQLFEIAAEKFGFTTNSKGFKVLNPKVRFIQGDGIDRHSIKTILARLAEQGWSADNLAFGSGGGLLQNVNRDTCKFAIKCSSITRNNVEQDVFKDPVTQPDKKSKRGRLSLVKRDDKYVTIRTSELQDGEKDLLEVVLDGRDLMSDTFEDIRARAAL